MLDRPSDPRWVRMFSVPKKIPRLITAQRIVARSHCEALPAAIIVPTRTDWTKIAGQVKAVKFQYSSPITSCPVLAMYR